MRRSICPELPASRRTRCEGGRRGHHGIDVFAPRGQPLGAVGNTGNARTTLPHLHFGLSQRFNGLVDPLPLTGTRRIALAPLEVLNAQPAWLAVRCTRANLRAGPGTDHAVLTTLGTGELLRVAGASGTRTNRWVRVRTGDGTQGFVARSLLDAPEATAGALAELAWPRTLHALPRSDAPELRALVREEAAALLFFGRFGEALRVATADGLVGRLLQDATLLERTRRVL